MSKKAKKPSKVVKKSKPAAVKSAKPAKKAVKKEAAKPSKKTVKKVAKTTEKALKALKSVKKAFVKAVSSKATTKPKGALKKEEPAKKSGKPGKVVKTEVEKTDLKTSKKTNTPKTLQAKGSVVVEESVEVKVETRTVKDVILTDAEGRILCRVKDCDQPSVVEGYCRYHYLFFWKKIQNRKKILSEGKLEQYIEELTSRYPLKFLELIRKDLGSEPDFLSAIQELDIDEASTNVDDFEDENFMEEVRGIGSGDTERVDDEY